MIPTDHKYSFSLAPYARQTEQDETDIEQIVERFSRISLEDNEARIVSALRERVRFFTARYIGLGDKSFLLDTITNLFYVSLGQSLYNSWDFIKLGDSALAILDELTNLLPEKQQRNEFYSDILCNAFSFCVERRLLTGSNFGSLVPESLQQTLLALVERATADTENGNRALIVNMSRGFLAPFTTYEEDLERIVAFVEKLPPLLREGVLESLRRYFMSKKGARDNAEEPQRLFYYYQNLENRMASMKALYS